MRDAKLTPTGKRLVLSLLRRWVALVVVTVGVCLWCVWTNHRTIAISVGVALFGLFLWDIRRTEERIRKAETATGFNAGDPVARAHSQGKASLLLRLLAIRFGPLPDDVRSRVLAASEQEVDTMASGLFTAKSLEEAVIQSERGT